MYKSVVYFDNLLPGIIITNPTENYAYHAILTYKKTVKKVKFNRKPTCLAFEVYPRQKRLGSPEIIINLVYGTEKQDLEVLVK